MSTPSLRINSGGMRPNRYAPVEVASPGALAKGFSVRAAPPTASLSSSTSTSSPRRASKSAAVRPLCPAPTTTTSAWLRIAPFYPRCVDSRHGRGQTEGQQAGDRIWRSQGDQERARSGGQDARSGGVGRARSGPEERAGQDAGQGGRVVFRRVGGDRSARAGEEHRRADGLPRDQ